MSLRGFYVNMHCIVFAFLKKQGKPNHLAPIRWCGHCALPRRRCGFVQEPPHNSSSPLPWANVNQLHYRDVVSNPQQDVLALYCLWTRLPRGNTRCAINSSISDSSAARRDTKRKMVRDERQRGRREKTKRFLEIITEYRAL